jgi:hypothetical protein
MSSGGPNLGLFVSAAAKFGVKPVQAATMFTTFSGGLKGSESKDNQINFIRAEMNDF